MAHEVPPPTPKKSTCAMHKCFYFLWAQLGLNQRPPDYELGNFLLYFYVKYLYFTIFVRCLQRFQIYQFY